MKGEYEMHLIQDFDEDNYPMVYRDNFITNKHEHKQTKCLK